MAREARTMAPGGGGMVRRLRSGAREEETGRARVGCWKYALEAIINVIIYFHIHN